MMKQNENACLSNKAVTPMVAQSFNQRLEETFSPFPITDEMSQTRGEDEQVDDMQLENLPDNFNIKKLLANFQKMKSEEQRLLELKQQILSKQRDLQNKLEKEIEKMKTTISNLTTEIPDLQNKTKQLEEAVGVEIRNPTRELEINSIISVEAEPEKDSPKCAGLLNCPKPEACGSYHSCLNRYVAAEIRNEVLTV